MDASSKPSTSSFSPPKGLTNWFGRLARFFTPRALAESSSLTDRLQKTPVQHASPRTADGQPQPASILLLPLRRLVYRSLACCEVSQVEQIFCDSQSHNARSGITGILFVSGPSFYQCIEGAPEAVGKLFDRIKRDKRHCMVEVLDDRPCDAPLYPFWSMGALLGYESVIKSVVPLLDSCDGLQVRVGLEMLALSMAHQDARAVDGSQIQRMMLSAPITDQQGASGHNAGQSSPWLSLMAENMYLKAQLLRAEAGRREFFSAISHEMRTPMSGMLSAADLLCHPKLNAAMVERQRSALKSSSDRFAKTLNDIFTLHRIESGDQAPLHERTHLHMQIQTACDALKHPDVNMNLTLADAELAECDMDTGLMQTVLTNLLNHAIKRSHNGQIAIDLRTLAVSDDHIWWRCGIRDYGSHVSVERLLTLFQPFSAGLDQGGGYLEDAGLDLALAGAIVKLLNGRMGAHNEPDGGLTVWFTLGLHKSHVHQSVPMTPRPAYASQ